MSEHKAECLQSSHNYWLDLVKLAGILLVAIFHDRQNLGWLTPYVSRGYLAVDLFFIISGCFLIRHVSLRDSFSTPAYLVHKFKRLYPAHLMCLVLTLGFALHKAGINWLNPLNWLEVVSNNTELLSELFLIHRFGLNGQHFILNVPDWYLSALLLNCALLYALLSEARRQRQERLLLCLLNILAAACYLYLFQHYGNLDRFAEKALGFTETGVLRGFADLILGLNLYTWVSRFTAAHPEGPEEDLSFWSKLGLNPLFWAVLYLTVVAFPSRGIFQDLSSVVVAAALVFSSLLAVQSNFYTGGKLILRFAQSRVMRCFYGLELMIFLCHWAVFTHAPLWILQNPCYYLLTCLSLAAVLEATRRGLAWSYQKLSAWAEAEEKKI